MDQPPQNPFLLNAQGLCGRLQTAIIHPILSSSIGGRNLSQLKGLRRCSGLPRGVQQIKRQRLRIKIGRLIIDHFLKVVGVTALLRQA